MDRRQQKTRAAIFSAFSALLSRKRYDKITVQDIIDEANVGRTTFYAHFQTKDDLLKETCTDIFEHVISGSLMMEGSHDFSLSGGSPQAVLTHILYHLRDSKKNIIGILSCESGDLFLQYFKTYLNRLLSQWIPQPQQPPLSGVPREFLIDHVSGSFVNMVQWWIRNNLRQAPEELSGYFWAVTGPILEGQPSNIQSL